MLDIYLLGTAGMQPLPGRYLSAALVRCNGHLFLLDCGEGTQVALRECGWGLRRLAAIFLTHMHGDHVLGIPGLLLTLANAGRTADEPLTIYGPEPLVPVMQGLLVVAPHLPFPVDLVTLGGGESVRLPGVERLTVDCLAVSHDVPCLAYNLALARAPRFDAQRASQLDIPIAEWRRLQRGETIQIADRVIVPADVLGPPRRGLRVSLVTDTRPSPALVEFLRGNDGGTDLLIADGMYGDESQKPRRWDPAHMTFAEAATLARDCRARRLWLTHFSPTLTNPHEYTSKATEIFAATSVGFTGLTTDLVFDD